MPSIMPAVLIGGGKQSEHVLRLMQWLGFDTCAVALFDDFHPRRLEGALGNKVQGTLSQGIAFCIQNELPAMIAIGSRHAAIRYALFRTLFAAGATIPSLIHPSCVIAPNALIGSNTLIMPCCTLGHGVKIGPLATLFANVTIEHDSVIGENVTFGPGVTVSGAVQIDSHCFIGAGATIAPEVKIGERCVIGAGAVVVNSIEPGMVAIGVPARPSRRVKQGDDAPTEEALKQTIAAAERP